MDEHDPMYSPQDMEELLAQAAIARMALVVALAGIVALVAWVMV